MTYISAKVSSEYFTSTFYKNNKPLEKNTVHWGITLKRAGNMKFRWTENNDVRNKMLEKICNNSCLNEANEKLQVVPIELIHSQIVYDVSNANDTKNLQGDGILTANKNLLPAVTVADCLPIYFYSVNTGVFGVVHSGWKGSGIIEKALNIAKEKYKANVEDFCVAIGPHIKECCYIVNEERANYFRNNFCEECVKEYIPQNSQSNKMFQELWNKDFSKLFTLSLEKVNISILLKLGINADNIVIAKECTCCTDEFGSYRRETSLNESEDFTVQCAFCGYVN